MTRGVCWLPGLFAFLHPDPALQLLKLYNALYSLFEKRALELNISQRSIDEFNNSDDKVLYYAHNFTEYEVQPSENASTTTKEALIQEVNTQLEISENIILTYSNHESISDDDLIIIQKHQKRQALLEDLLERLQSINSNDKKQLILFGKNFRTIF